MAGSQPSITNFNRKISFWQPRRSSGDNQALRPVITKVLLAAHARKYPGFHKGM